ncbi:hypothetical protein [Streptomyces chartreusis]
MDDLPDDLISLERSAWAEIQAGRLTVSTALKVHRGVAAFAAQSGVPRIEVEAALKRAVRHSEEESADGPG